MLARGVALGRGQLADGEQVRVLPEAQGCAGFVVTAEQLLRRLVSLVPPAKTHLSSFHGVY
ncbi:MAG: hypothetical protein Q8S33_13500 [Myxococcales bacterium]|nr:hypothetical protein [Myxococcales bacterium]